MDKDATSDSTAPATQSLDGLVLPSGVVHIRPAPAQTALLVGDVNGDSLSEDDNPVTSCLIRLSCLPVHAAPATALETATEVGPFILALLGPEVLEEEEGVHLVADLLALSPAAKVLLLAAPETLSPTTLLRAIRAGVLDVIDPHNVILLTTTIERCLRGAGEAAERVLAIGAHPDDVEIGCAGTLLDHRRRGDQVAILTLSQGSVGGDQQERLRESTDAAARIGGQLMLADLPDTRIDPGVDTIRLIEEVVRAFDPTVIYVHSNSDNHQDHRAVHTATMSATRRVPRVYAYQSPSASNDFSPTRYVPIDGVIIQKVEVLSMFVSQSERSYLEPEMVIASARYWARNLAPRAKYAEPFEIIRSFIPGRPEPRSRPSDAFASVVPIETGSRSA